MPLQISEKVMALAAQAQAGLRDQFDRIDSIAEENTRKVLAAFQKHRVAEAYFAGTTGYGYDDLGRDKLDGIFAELFGTEDALVRVQFVNGTHAISCALFGALKPGDILVSAVGAPYDTMLGVIGVVDKGPGSLKSYGIEYRQVDLLDNAPDPEGLARAVRDPRVKAVLIQRSKGYSTRRRSGRCARWCGPTTRRPPFWWTTATASLWRHWSPPRPGPTWWWVP